MNLISLLLYKDKINFEISERVEKVNIKERELCQKLTLVRLQIWDFSQCWVKLESPDAICWLSLLCLIQSWFSECLRITDRLPPPDFVIIFLLLFVQASVSLYTWALGQKKKRKEKLVCIWSYYLQSEESSKSEWRRGTNLPGTTDWWQNSFRAVTWKELLLLLSRLLTGVRSLRRLLIG